VCKIDISSKASRYIGTLFFGLFHTRKKSFQPRAKTSLILGVSIGKQGMEPIKEY